MVVAKRGDARRVVGNGTSLLLGECRPFKALDEPHPMQMALRL